MSEEHLIPRKQTLTDADMAALAKLLQEQHRCRFDNITKEDMDFLKDLLTVYKETRSEVIKWAVKGIIYGSLLLVAIAAYFKLGKH